jgi:predicted protein tyrosine phosphatase
MIYICGRPELIDIIDSGDKFNSIVSIMDPFQGGNFDIDMTELRDKLKKQCVSLYTFNFSDMRKQRTIHPDAPSVELIMDMQSTCTKILSADNKDDTLLVHCNAGVSRSTAFVYILLRESGLTSDESLKKIYEIRSIAQPNQRMIYLYEKYN